MTALPSECWLQILEDLSPEDLLPLSLVSKSCNGLAVPFLYRNISWDWRPIPARRILLLLRAILQRPERASHIHHVSLLSFQRVLAHRPWDPPICEPGCKEQLAGFKDVLQQAQSIVETAKFTDADAWTQALETGDPYAFVAILLSQLHGLRSLRLDYSFVWMSGFPGLMLRHALFSPAKGSISEFTSLAEVDYGGNVRRATINDDMPEIYDDEGYPSCNPDQFVAWFYLPSLHSLAIWLRTKEGLERPGRRANLAQLRNLVLARATIHEDQVPGLLSSATNLKTLHLGMAYRWGYEVALTNGPAVLQGLNLTRKTVTNLSFGVEYYPPNMGMSWLERGEEELSAPFHGFLTEFSNLRYAEVPINLLVGWSIQSEINLASLLPDTVEQICLRADYGPFDENDWHERTMLDLVRDNVTRLKVHAPRLRRISLRVWNKFWETKLTGQKREEVQDICGREGIHLEMVFDHLSTGLWTETAPPPERKVF